MTEKKTTKKVAPKTTQKAATVKKAAPKKVEVKECNCGCNCTGMLNNIFYCLLIIIVLLGLILVVNITNKSVTSNTNNNSEVTEESNSEYDVSMFDELTTTEAIAKIKKGDKVVLYIGRPSCGYCVKFLPFLQQAQNEYGYKTVYVDLEKVTSEDQAKWNDIGGVLGAYDETCENAENVKSADKCGQFGFTPMVVVFEKGKIKGDHVGYSDYDSFAAFLEDNGFKK